VGEETLTVPRYGGVLVGPDQLRQVFNDTDAEVLWLIIGAPEELEFLQCSKSTGMDLKLIYPTDPTQLPKELASVPSGPGCENRFRPHDLFGRTGKSVLVFSRPAGDEDFDGVQAAVLHRQAELFVDFRESVLLEAIAHVAASVRTGRIAMLIPGYLVGEYRP
jgi:hypothetical protein